MTLPNCDCPACRRAVAILARPATLTTLDQALAQNAAWLARMPVRVLVPRDQCEPQR